MASLQPVRGTHDILPEQERRHRRVEETARDIAARYGFAEMSTPIFEFTEVFARSIGETTDIVMKEMYTFTDKGGETITLRPEGTAGVARAFISNGLAQQVPFKVFYRGPMFRYERPQKGRQRQFNQIGVELIGVADPQADIEAIALGAHILDALGVADRAVLELNTLGDGESRAAYRETLVAYLRAYEKDLSEDSRLRLDRNPLRILDSKDEGDRAIVANAPTIHDSLNDASRRFFEDVREGLTALDIAYAVNPHLVRGLDYYGHTAFEFTTTDLGAQGALLAGGRYDGLIKLMGGPATPGIGWAAGVERLAMMIGEPEAGNGPVAVIPVGAEQKQRALVITHELRGAGFAVELGFSGNMSKRMNRANKMNACAAVILGEDELAKGVATVRDMTSGEQREVPLDGLAGHLDKYRS
ncbi:MAG: histidine--tRNA ligase [Rhodospirillales bacterium]